MQHEHNPQSTSLSEIFSFTSQEAERYQVSHDRFEVILATNETTVHQTAVEQRDFGEFLFITLSRHAKFVIFYGLGEHRHRQRWYSNTWFWSPLQSIPAGDPQTLSKAEIKTIIHHRQQAIAKQVSTFRATKEAALSTLLAHWDNPTTVIGQQTAILNLLDDLREYPG